MAKPVDSSAEERLVRSVDALNTTLCETNYLTRMLWVNFLKGIFYGMGFLIALALAVPLAVSLLRSVDWVPIIGDFLTEVAVWIEKAQIR
ncbi:MAG: DUF5665 domain-containing protein [Candidatus Peregrinibacteria bacterium]